MSWDIEWTRSHVDIAPSGTFGPANLDATPRCRIDGKTLEHAPDELVQQHDDLEALQAVGSIDPHPRPLAHALVAHGHALTHPDSDPLGSITRPGADAPRCENAAARTAGGGPRRRSISIHDLSTPSGTFGVTSRSCTPDRRHPLKVAARARPLARRSRRPAAPPREETRRTYGSALPRFFPRRIRGRWRPERRETGSQTLSALRSLRDGTRISCPSEWASAGVRL